MTRRPRRAVAGLALVVLLLGAACTTEREPDERTLAARERVRAGLAATNAATSGRLEMSTRVSTGPGDGAPGGCVSATWDETTYEQEHHWVMHGTPVSTTTCAPERSFVVRGDVVYVPSDETPEGRHWFLHHWAHVEPQVLSDLADSSEVDERFLRLVATSDLVRDDAGDDDRLEFDLDLQALAAAGLVDDTELLDELTGRVTFELTDDALTRIHVRVTGDGLSLEIDQQFSELGVPQEFEIPEDPFLHPESPRITTPAELRELTGIG